MKHVTLTKAMIDAGMNLKGRLNPAQIVCLGAEYPPREKGWLKRLVGKSISLADYQRFLDLKGAFKADRGSLAEKGRRAAVAKETEYVVFENCYIGAVTEKAVQVHFENEAFWVPKSLIREPDRYKRWDEGVTVEVAEWFARKERMI